MAVDGSMVSAGAAHCEAPAKGYAVRRVDLPAFLERLSGMGDLYAPVYEDGVPVLARVGAVTRGTLGRVAWDFPKTVIPAKGLFFPHTERFLKFRRLGCMYGVQPIGSVAPAVLFGVKPCDMAAVDMLRRVMAEGRFRDEAFEERRNSVAAISVACEEMGRYCFCEAFGLSPGSTRGVDLILYPAGEMMYAVAVTRNGEHAVGLGGSLFAPASAEEVEKAASRYAGTGGAGAGYRGLTNEGVSGASARMAGGFHLSYWEEASERCLSCGICTYLCPTCHCFAVVDRLRGDGGTRSKCWDSCMYAGYSLIAGGHNPRPTMVERVRQRFMHKLVYHRERYGEVLCVGCGRCVEKCPVGLHIASVVEEMAVSGCLVDTGSV